MMDTGILVVAKKLQSIVLTIGIMAAGACALQA